MPTTSRNVRIPDDLWAKAQAKAATEYTTVSAVIIRLLAEWVREDALPARSRGRRSR